MERSMQISVILVLFLAGCAAVPVPKMEQTDASGIAISVKVKAPPFGFPTESAVKVFFARIDGSGSIQQSEVIPSNYNKDGRVYLLNATPGEYVAVAASLPRQSASPGPAAPGLSVTVTLTKQNITFFQKEVVDQIRVSVGKAQMVCAGDYILSASLLGERDAIQRHYETVILGLDEPLTTAEIVMRGGGWGKSASWRGMLHEAKNGDDAKSDCFRKAKEDLAEGGWHMLIK